MTTDSTSILKKLLLLFLVLAGLHYAKVFLMPMSIGGLLATLLLPFCRWMEKIKIPKGVAVLICILTLLLAMTGIVIMIALQIAEFTNDFTLIKQKVIEEGSRLQEYIFSHLGISAETQIQILKSEQPSVSGILQIIAGSLAYILTNLVLILVYTFGLLYYRRHILQFLIKLAPPATQKEMEHVVYSAVRVSQQYLVGLTKMIVCLWIMYGIGFSIVGVPNAFFFAVLCGILEIVPFIGNITGTTLTVLVAAVHGASLSMIIGIVITYGVVQFIQGWLLEPLIVGPQVKINPFTTIVALVLGELIWGIPGIILAIPLIAMFKIVCDHIESLKPYGFLIGELETPKKQPGFIKKIKTSIIKKGR